MTGRPRPPAASARPRSGRTQVLARAPHSQLACAARLCVTTPTRHAHRPTRHSLAKRSPPSRKATDVARGGTAHIAGPTCRPYSRPHTRSVIGVSGSPSYAGPRLICVFEPFAGDSNWVRPEGSNDMSRRLKEGTEPEACLPLDDSPRSDAARAAPSTCRPRSLPKHRRAKAGCPSRGARPLRGSPSTPAARPCGFRRRFGQQRSQVRPRAGSLCFASGAKR